MSIRSALSVTELNRRARELLEGSFAAIAVEGETSGVKRAASGHLYFTLKDAGAELRCVWYRGSQPWRARLPVDGEALVVHGRLTLYEPRGDLQLLVSRVEAAGLGALLKRLEERKRRLAAEGLFEAARKRPLPAWPRHLALLTSRQGAAFADVRAVCRARFPLLAITLVPVPVQGRDAPPEIIAGLRRAVALSPPPDVLLLTRGGGSVEDLMAFNDEALVRAIAASPIPVVCAVGHEIDLTLAELAADLRAATPSAAAERLTPAQETLGARILHASARLRALGMARLGQYGQRLDHALQRLERSAPAERLARGAERLASLQTRLGHCGQRELLLARQRLERVVARLAPPRERLTAASRRLSDGRTRLGSVLRLSLERRERVLSGLLRALTGLSPQAVLARGYALVSDAASGAVVSQGAGLRPGQELTLRFAADQARVVVCSSPSEAGEGD